MIWYTAGHQYAHFHANIHMYTKVIEILSFQWRPFEIQNGGHYRSQITCPHVLHDFNNNNYQHTQVHAFMTI